MKSGTLLGLALSALLFCTAAPRASANDLLPESEYVILSGGPSLILWEKWKNPPHDLWWQNFIRAAEIRILELEAQGIQASQITWFVYQPAYETRARQEGKNLMADITTRARSMGVRLKPFRSSQEIFRYLNAGRPREQVKVADLEYFGHSNKACWMFDYSNQIDSASKVWMHEEDFNQLQPGIFTRDAHVKSWGCHTGESMSRKFRSTTGVKMWGAVGRTQYNTHELPSLAQPDTGKWKY